jgi:hypothetical protein
MNSKPTDEEMERFKRSDYEQRGRWQISWDIKADMLKRAADLLLEAYRCKCAELDSQQRPRVNAEGAKGWIENYDIVLWRVYYMLMGYSIENRIKGIIMVNHPDYLDEMGLARIRGHNTRASLSQNGIREFEAYDDILQ